MTSFSNSILSMKNKILLPKNGSLSFTRFDHGKLESPGHKVNKLEKIFLVWTGKYKNVADVPNYVSQSVVERARNRMRIRIANYMMLATAIGCIAMVYSGKKAAERGDTVPKQSRDWHKELKEEKN